jgi:hypothetical protein
MLTVVCGLAVYKLMQLVDSLLPKEPMPWVKVLASCLLSVGVSFVTHDEYEVIYGLAIATLAGATHTGLRLVTLTGDLMRRRSTTR